MKVQKPNQPKNDAARKHAVATMHQSTSVFNVFFRMSLLQSWQRMGEALRLCGSLAGCEGFEGVEVVGGISILYVLAL